MTINIKNFIQRRYKNRALNNKSGSGSKLFGFANKHKMGKMASRLDQRNTRRSMRSKGFF